MFDGPRMSFVVGIICPQASQMCCDKFFVLIEESKRTTKLIMILNGDPILQSLHQDHSSSSWQLISFSGALPGFHAVTHGRSPLKPCLIYAIKNLSQAKKSHKKLVPPAGRILGVVVDICKFFPISRCRGHLLGQSFASSGC